MYGNSIDRYVRIGAKLFALGGWILSIIFSASGFGFEGGAQYVMAGYFLALLVTLFEVVLNRFGSQLPKTLAWICFLAYVFGCVTNMIGIYQGRGGESGWADVLIAVVLGLILEIYPEPLFMFAAGVSSSDLLETLSGLMPSRRRQKHRQPDYQPQRNQPRPYQEPPIYQSQGSAKRQKHMNGPRPPL